MLYVFLVIGSVNGLSYLVSRSATPDFKPEDSPSQVQQGPEPSKAAHKNPPEKLASQFALVTKPPQDSRQVQVDVTLKSQSWMRVVADGKTQFEGVLPEGTKRNWSAEKKLIVRAGNAGGVLVEFNNQTAKEMGAPGEVQELTFAANPGS